MKPFISVESLSFSYPRRAVLQEISLSVGCGEAVAVLGRNGTGKTTLLHLVLGRLIPESGAIIIDARPIRSFSRRQLGRTMSLVPQAELVAFDYTVLEYVLLGRAPHLNPTQTPGMKDIDVAKRALERVGIADLANRAAGKLSGGELQLVLLARSLAQEPRLLLLDEPSSHLDISNKVRLLTVLQQLKREGVSMIFSTHDPDFAAALADRVALLNDRRFLAVGPPDQTLTQKNLSSLYGVPVTVRSVDGTICLRWHPARQGTRPAETPK